MKTRDLALTGILTTAFMAGGCAGAPMIKMVEGTPMIKTTDHEGVLEYTSIYEPLYRIQNFLSGKSTPEYFKSSTEPK